MAVRPYTDYDESGIDVRTGLHHSLVLHYENTQYGSTIAVHPSGDMDARKADGKRKKTSATPLSLYEGHGKWILVGVEEVDE